LKETKHNQALHLLLDTLPASVRQTTQKEAGDRASLERTALEHCYAAEPTR